MDYVFEDRRLARAAASDVKLRRDYGAERAKKLRQRFAQLRTAESMADLALMSGRFHALTGDRDGEYSLDLDGPHRLIIRPEKIGDGDDGVVDLATVCSVVIVEIVDYH